MSTIHITRGTTSLGTFSEEEVHEGLRTGRFNSTDLGWREGMSTWEPLSRWPEFTAAAFSPSSPEPRSTITPPASIPPPSAATPAARSGLPWENRAGRPLFSAFFETLQMILSRPAVAFTAMKREGGLGGPLLYAVIGGSVGFVCYLLFIFLMPSVVALGRRDNPLTHLVGAGIGLVLVIIFVPLLVVIGAFIHAAIVHVCLMLVGGAKQSFETTFRVICFEVGSIYPFLLVPFCGGMIAGIWGIVLRCIGLSRAHEIDTGRAVLAVFLPLILCCGAWILFAMLFGGLSALSHHGN